MQDIYSELGNRVHKTQSIIEGVLNTQDKVICSTKFGLDSLVFLHLVTRIAPDIPIAWVDTGYNSRHTLAFVDDAVRHLGLNLHRFKPEGHSVQIPPSLDDPAHQEFKETVKVKPFQKALKKLDASCWMSSVRAYQTPNRRTLPTILKLSNQLTKVHPMLAWSEANVIEYRKLHNLPEGPEAYDPTKGDAQRECGLHEVGSFFTDISALS